jgi:hypothetical protein
VNLVLREERVGVMADDLVLRWVGVAEDVGKTRSLSVEDGGNDCESWDSCLVGTCVSI